MMMLDNYEKLELPYFTVSGKPGFDQDLFRRDISSKDYMEFSKLMKLYLRPRSRGICSTDLYIRGFEEYIAMAESSFGKDTQKLNRHLSMSPLSGQESFEKAEEAVRKQLVLRYPIPILILDHNNPVFDDYIWHWFLITGHQYIGRYSIIKAITYGEERWLDFPSLWDTGFSEKGGMVIFELI